MFTVTSALFMLPLAVDLTVLHAVLYSHEPCVLRLHRKGTLLNKQQQHLPVSGD